VNDVATLILPDEAVALGPMTATDTFKVLPQYGAKGITYRVERT
jgi:hypothetical protein